MRALRSVRTCRCTGWTGPVWSRPQRQDQASGWNCRIQPMSDQYRPDIDGLRAIAVSSVVLFHAGLPPFHSGFVGVDIFFVISGYLIGGIIIRETMAGRFSFANFYARRARRILPVLIVVVLASCILGWLLLD